jgi:hypothetical protein
MADLASPLIAVGGVIIGAALAEISRRAGGRRADQRE